MSEVKIDFVHSADGDWVGLYLEERLLAEGHSLTPEEIVQLLIDNVPVENTKVESHYNWDGEEQGRLPTKWRDIKWLKSV